MNIYWQDVVEQGLPVRLHRFPGGNSCYRAMTPKGEATVYWEGRETVYAQRALDKLAALNNNGGHDAKS